MIPPEEDAEFIYYMEDVLALYHEPYDPNQPVVCFDEHPTELTEEVRAPLRLRRAGSPAKTISTALTGGRTCFWHPNRSPARAVTVTNRRTKRDWVTFMRYLVDEHYPDADCIRVVLDNLNKHNPAAFCEYFEPVEARQLLDKLKFYFTPVHGSWLHMAEIEFNTIQQQCLDRRISDATTLRQEVAGWKRERNSGETDIDWRFTTGDTRIKLKRLYPSINEW